MALTNACDLSCQFCYAPKHSASLHPERVKAWLVELDAEGCVGVGFGGGEPTLHKCLPEICEFITRNTTLAVSITSHGHFFHRGLVDKLAANIHFVRISMDGVGPTYESIRGKSFGALLDRILEVRKVVAFGINFVVNGRTFPDLPKAIEIASELGAREVVLLPEIAIGRGQGIDRATETALAEWIRGYHCSIPLGISETGATGLPVCVPWPKETGLCAYAHIDASGVLKRRSYDSDGVVVGRPGVIDAIQHLREQNAEVLQ
jgi:molybdenum cofactor biosynthesis enzyme MoaA